MNKDSKTTKMMGKRYWKSLKELHGNPDSQELMQQMTIMKIIVIHVVIFLD